MNTFGDRLRAARTAKGYTQEELADLMEVSKQSVSAWENNRETPSFERLPRLRDALGAALDELICGSAVLLVSREEQGPYEIQPLLTIDERRLVRRFRRLNERRQKALITVLGE